MNAFVIGFTESEGQEGRKYYAQHAGIDQPDGRNTPKESNVPFDTNYTCKHCGKMYRQNQRLYYKRHIEHLEQRCPKFSQTECNKEHFDISKNLDVVFTDYSQHSAQVYRPLVADWV